MDARGGLPALWGNEGALRRAEGLEVSRQGRGGGGTRSPHSTSCLPCSQLGAPGGQGRAQASLSQ